VERIVREEEVREAIERPPADTRAYFRGMCLKKYGESVYGASWSSILLDVGDPTIKKLPMLEPARGTRKLVGEILDRSETAAELLAYISG